MAQYAIISLGGKQYVVREGETFLVDHLDREEGKTFQPDVLFLGGEKGGELAPRAANVTAKIVAHERGPKVLIGKYRPKSGYKRHTGFRAALTRVEITGIGAGDRAATAKPSAEKQPEQAPPAESKPREAEAAAPKGLPKGYSELTVAEVSEGAKTWNRPMLEAALAYEREHAKRKGAIAALEHALAAKEEH
jgi:large subunit ribosomal protein L21